MDVSRFNDLAEQHQFIVAYPDGLQASWGTGLPGASTADDMGFLEALATQLTVDYGIDSTRVYSCGFSAGGYMSHRLACESTRCFAAIASVSGTMMPTASAACAPIHPTPVMQIHGTSDIVVSYTGGAISGLGAEEVMAQWNAFDNCPTDPVVASLPNTDLFDFCTVDELVYSPCDLNIHNVLLRVNGGGHQWPGTNILLGGIGNINQDIDASERIWSFFGNYTCGDVSTGALSITPEAFNAAYDPANDQLIITWNGPVREWHLLDATGRIVRKGVLTPGTDHISARECPPGVFLLVVSGADGRYLRFAKS
jgi:polyhydroxybutyrate depolymerase